MTDTAKFCPACQSPMVMVSSLVGGDAHCEVCHWTGRTDDLLTHCFKSGFNSPEEIFKTFGQEVKMLLVRNGVAVELGRLIVKWGFVPNLDAQTLTRYMVAVARGVTSAILEERRIQEKERLSAS